MTQRLLHAVGAFGSHILDVQSERLPLAATTDEPPQHRRHERRRPASGRTDLQHGSHAQLLQGHDCCTDLCRDLPEAALAFCASDRAARRALHHCRASQHVYSLRSIDLPSAVPREPKGAHEVGERCCILQLTCRQLARYRTRHVQQTEALHWRADGIERRGAAQRVAKAHRKR